MLLDRTISTPRPADQRARNREAMTRCLAGTLTRGELARLVMGGGTTATSRDRGTCVDCHLPLLHGGDQLAQQPNRCRPCAQQRRADYNRRARSPQQPPVAADA